jgi:hypothetical protein
MHRYLYRLGCIAALVFWQLVAVLMIRLPCWFSSRDLTAVPVHSVLRVTSVVGQGQSFVHAQFSQQDFSCMLANSTCTAPKTHLLCQPCLHEQDFGCKLSWHFQVINTNTS